MRPAQGACLFVFVFNILFQSLLGGENRTQKVGKLTILRSI